MFQFCSSENSGRRHCRGFPPVQPANAGFGSASRPLAWLAENLNKSSTSRSLTSSASVAFGRRHWSLESGRIWTVRAVARLLQRFRIKRSEEEPTIAGEDD